MTLELRKLGADFGHDRRPIVEQADRHLGDPAIEMDVETRDPSLESVLDHAQALDRTPGDMAAAAQRYAVAVDNPRPAQRIGP
jgi:hypothetical protein